MNNEFYDANAVAKGGIPAVALVAAPDSPPALADEAEEARAFCAEVVETSTATAGTSGDFSGDWAVVVVEEEGSLVDKKGLEEENWMPP